MTIADGAAIRPQQCGEGAADAAKMQADCYRQINDVSSRNELAETE